MRWRPIRLIRGQIRAETGNPCPLSEVVYWNDSNMFKVKVLKWIKSKFSSDSIYFVLTFICPCAASVLSCAFMTLFIISFHIMLVRGSLADEPLTQFHTIHPSIHPSIHFHPLHTRMFHKWLTPVSDSILRSDWLEGVSSLSSSPETVSMLALPVPSSQSLTVCSMCFQLNLYKKLCVRTGWTYSHILFSNINRHQMCHSLIVKLFVLKTVSGC